MKSGVGAVQLTSRLLGGDIGGEWSGCKFGLERVTSSAASRHNALWDTQSANCAIAPFNGCRAPGVCVHRDMILGEARGAGQADPGTWRVLATELLLESELDASPAMPYHTVECGRGVPAWYLLVARRGAALSCLKIARPSSAACRGPKRRLVHPAGATFSCKLSAEFSGLVRVSKTTCGGA